MSFLTFGDSFFAMEITRAKWSHVVGVLLLVPLFVVAITAAADVPSRVPTETPITRIKADYLCPLGEGNEVVGFTMASPGSPAKVWLGMADNDMGLQPELLAFTYQACPGCFKLSAQYSFSGGANILHFETVAQGSDFPAGAWPPEPPAAVVNPGQDEPIELPDDPSDNLFRPSQILNVDCDVPPGMELPPGCGDNPDDDRPPGSDPLPEEPTPTPTPTPTPEEPAVPVGPPLRIRYYETSIDGARIFFQSTGTCQSTR